MNFAVPDFQTVKQTVKDAGAALYQSVGAVTPPDAQTLVKLMIAYQLPMIAGQSIDNSTFWQPEVIAGFSLAGGALVIFGVGAGLGCALYYCCNKQAVDVHSVDGSSDEESVKLDSYTPEEQRPTETSVLTPKGKSYIPSSYLTPQTPYGRPGFVGISLDTPKDDSDVRRRLNFDEDSGKGSARGCALF